MWDTSTSYIILVSVFTGVTQRTISRILCTDLRRGVFVFFLEKRALTAMSAVPEQHEETAGHQVKTPGVTEQQRYLRDIRADAKYSHFVCDR